MSFRLPYILLFTINILTIFLIPILATDTAGKDQLTMSLPSTSLSLPECLESSIYNLVLPSWTLLDAHSSTALGLTSNFTSIITPSLHYITPVLTFIIAHPWLLTPLLIPLMDTWLILLGFSSALGIVPDSFAARLQSYIGDVPKGSLFAFFQKHGARRFGVWGLQRGGVWVVVAVVLVVVLAVLVENGVGEERVGMVVERVWNATVVKWGSGVEGMARLDL